MHDIPVHGTGCPCLCHVHIPVSIEICQHTKTTACQSTDSLKPDVRKSSMSYSAYVERLKSLCYPMCLFVCHNYLSVD